MARKTPPMAISGAFILRDPFSVSSDSTYTVVALRTFDELIARGQDPLRLIYTPVELTQTTYNADKAEGALVVCLRDKTGNLTYVPDTYIDSYPNMGSVPYSRLIIGVSLGMWPDYRNIDDVTESIRESVKAKIGVDPELSVTRGLVSDYVSETRHAQLTAARENSVEDNETDTATIIRLSDEIARLNGVVAEQEILIQALATPTP
ncbi:hypothetical protein D9M68_18030 [compost metagenome]